MKPQELSKAQNPDLRASQAALQTGTAIVMVRDSKPARITAEELRREQRA